MQYPDVIVHEVMPEITVRATVTAPQLVNNHSGAFNKNVKIRKA